jgi:hypothetical protein
MFGYIERTYVGRYKTNKKNEMRWKKPRYEIKCWNVRERVLSNLPRTQNNQESWIDWPYNIGKFSKHISN